MTHSNGYPQVHLRVKGSSRISKVHRLVAESFLPPQPFPGAIVRHLDGNPANNAADNLAWGTQAENRVDRIRTLGRGGVPPVIVAKAFAVAVATVSDIVSGKTWGHQL
jgi:hypothetical protein